MTGPVKLRRNGTSLCLTLPKDVVKKAGLQEGDHFTWELLPDGLKLKLAYRPSK